MTSKRKNKYRICPLCGKRYNELPALSRKDGKTQICPACGTEEALLDLMFSENDNHIPHID